MLQVFNTTNRGPMDDEELRRIRLAIMPYLLEDGRRSDLALLVSRLIETIDAARSSGGVEVDAKDITVESVVRHPGGQHVGTEAGVRIIHASGLVAEARTDRSQLRNRQIASDMLLGGLTSPHFRG
jgi:protein subunit release factor B